MQSIRDELETLYDQCGLQFYNCALAVTRCGGMAEDAVHNAFQSAFQLKRKPDNFRAYVYRSVRNAAIDLVRNDSRTEPISADMIFEIPAAQSSELESREFLEHLSKALEKLSPDERETIVQHLAAHLTFQEIATLRDRPLGTVTSWYRRGIKNLKLQLQHEYGPV